MLKTFASLPRSIRKNWPEIKASLSGRMPAFVYGLSSVKGIPVFCFHDADPDLLRSQLEFLRANKYRFLTGDEFCERLADAGYRNTNREILLTFDDGLLSVWEHGFPLLQEFEAKAVLFVVAELVPDSDQTLAGDNVVNPDSEVSARQILELCTWAKLLQMEQSGLVDVQSHSCLHARVSATPQIVDFVGPDFPLGAFGTVQAYECTRIPLYRTGSGVATRRAVLGHPVYENSSVFSVDAYLADDGEVRERCADYVRRNGGADFFVRPGWRRELLAIASDVGGATRSDPQFSSSLSLMHRELSASKRLIEAKLGKQVKHFCYPWFQFNDSSLRIAQECGYEAAYVGPVASHPRRHGSGIWLVPRLHHEYVFRLPGAGRRGLAHLVQLKRSIAAKGVYGN
jgi:peptidoglycan/xylan/chitin deacetylase (PgdA/CDA1 family)